MYEVLSLAVGTVVFTISSLYWVNGSIHVSSVSSYTAIFVILGFLHAYNVYELDNLVSRRKKGLFWLFCYSLMYTGWYNAVLLPESGLGYIEWIIVLLLLSSNIISEIFTKKINNPFVGQRPLVLAYMGIVLFVLKLFFFYIFSDNIYDSIFLNNGTARFFVGAFSGLGIIMLLMQFTNHVKNKLSLEAQNKIFSAAKGIFQAIVKFVKSIASLIVSCFSGPVVIIIAIVVGLLVLLCGFMTANAIYNDILAFVEPLLEKLASTGENLVHPSAPYYMCQTISMAIVLFYTKYIENVMEENIDTTIRTEIRNITDNHENGNVYFEKTSKELLQKSFSEKICLLQVRQNGTLNNSAEREVAETVKRIESQNQ